MILTMDIGNTNIKIGIFDGNAIIESWRISVKTQKTADEYGMTLKNLFSSKNIYFEDIDGIIISSVVPCINYTLEHMCNYYFKINPIMVSSDIKTGLKYDYDNPLDIGADRIANAVAAYKIYGLENISSVIIVDLGTATTIGAVSKDGVFLGGAIAPGLKSSVDALSSNAARLQRIELKRPQKAIGKSTVENMLSGAVLGFTGLVEKLIEKFKEEIKDDNVKVVATGGLTELIDNTDNKIFDYVDRALTLKGLKIIFDMNKTKECI